MLKWLFGLACVFGIVKAMKSTTPNWRCFLCRSHNDGPRQTGLWVMKCHRCEIENTVRFNEGETQLIQGDIPHIEVPHETDPNPLERLSRPTFTETQYKKAQNSDVNQ